MGLDGSRIALPVVGVALLCGQRAGCSRRRSDPARCLNKYGSGEILYLPQTTEALTAASPIWDRVMAGKLGLEEGLNQIAAAMTPILAKNAS